MKLNTVDGRPEIKEDWTARFSKERRDRLADAIGEYLTDEDLDANMAYEDLLAEVDGWIDYYRRYLIKAENLRALLVGNKQ